MGESYNNNGKLIEPTNNFRLQKYKLSREFDEIGIPEIEHFEFFVSVYDVYCKDLKILRMITNR